MKTPRFHKYLSRWLCASALAGAVPGSEAPGFTLKDVEGNEHTLQAYLDEDRNFVRRIVDDAPVVSGPLAGRRALEGVLAGNESIRTGQAVSLGR